MPRFVIERTFPNAGAMSISELRDVSGKFSRVIREVGPPLQWVQSLVADDKLYCVYLASGPDPIREHAVRGGFALESVREVKAIIDPTTAE